MSHCQLKYGFFTMAECQENAVATCPNCHKEVCEQHWQEELQLCAECAAGQITPEQSSSLSQGADNYNGFGMKQHYYAQDWYQTHRTHGSYTGEFADSDFAAFDQPLVDDVDVDSEDYQYRDIYDS